MKFFKKIGTVLIASILLLSSCGGAKTGKAMEAAKQLETAEVDKQMINTPTTYGSGVIETASVQTFYEKSEQKWQEMITEGNVPKQYIESVEAQQKIAAYLTTSLKSEAIEEIAYVGDSADGEAKGIFIYYFSAPITLTQEQLDKANELTVKTKTGEYYVMKDQYLFTIDQSMFKEDAEMEKKVIEILETEVA